MLRHPRTHSGRASVPSGRSVCTVGFFTDGHGRAALAACSGLTCAVELGVHPLCPPGHVACIVVVVAALTPSGCLVVAGAGWSSSPRVASRTAGGALGEG